MKKTINLFLMFLVSSLILSNMSIAKNDNRKRISSTESNFSSVEDLEAEILFGRDLAARILGNYKLVNDDALIKYVNMVGKSMSMFSGRPEVRFYFSVLDSKEINAFATPGGYIFITKGALMEMTNEAQLAGVLGHEIAHVTQRHVVRNLNIQGGDDSAFSVFSGLIGGTTATFRDILEQAINEAAKTLFEKGYKLREEMQADNQAILMAGAAGYDPMGLINFLTKCKGFEKKDSTYKGDYPQPALRTKAMVKTIAVNGLDKIKTAKVRRRFYANVKTK